jgi:hypothetical protein
VSLIEERDALYALLLECLDQPEKKEGFRRLAAQAPPGGYAARKAPRYLEALEGWRPSGRALPDALALSERLFNAGLYFDTHEYLESAWKEAPGPWKPCLQGLIQLGAGLHKLELDPGSRAGALYLLERGLQKLKAHPELLGKDILSGIEKDLKPVLTAIRTRKNFKPPRLNIGGCPQC